MSKAKPSQKDVAIAANVSQGLVSLVLNNASSEVSEATRVRILEAAKRLGYVPRKRHEYEPKGAALRKRRRLLAYIPQTVVRNIPQDSFIYDSYEDFYNRFQSRLVEAASERDFSLLVRPCTDPTQLTGWLIEWGVDGVIMHSSNQALGEWISRRYPMVQINRQTVPDADTVMLNQEAMIQIAVEHLQKQGHRDIAFITASYGGVDIVDRRIQAYARQMRKAGGRVYEELFNCDNYEAVSSRFFGMDRKQWPTAVIAGDSIALMLQKEMASRGFSLPGDLSVVGIDNISASAYAAPALTSVDVCPEEITRWALASILERLETPTLAFKKVEVTPRLVMRESVAPPRKAAATPSLRR